MEENKNLDMDVFGDAPIIDMSTDEADFLFPEEIEDSKEETSEEEIEEKTENSSDEDGENPESVVGNDDNQEETDGEDESAENVDNEESSPTPNLFSSLTTLLTESGLITSVDPDIKIEDEESFVELFKNEIKKNEYSDLTEEGKLILDKFRKGLPQTNETVEDSRLLSQLESIKEDNVKEDSSLRQRIIYQDFINRGYSHDKAKKYLQRSIELEEDFQDAVEALESIKEFNKTKIEEKEKQLLADRDKKIKNEEKRINNIKNKIKNSSEIFENIKVTEGVKNKMEKTMFDIVGKSPEGQDENSLMKYARENREDFDLKLYYLFTITNGFKDFGNLEKDTKSKAIKDLQQAIESNTRIKESNGPIYKQDPDSYLIDISGHELP